MSDLLPPILATDTDAAIVRATYAAMDPALLTLFLAARVRVRVLESGERFADVGKMFHTADAIDYGICRGLYCPSERLIIIRDAVPAVIAHEHAHVIDYLLGDGTKFRSQIDDGIARAYRDHKRGDGAFISMYASYNCVEWVAECMRAAMSPLFSLQPPGRLTDLERLERIDPKLVAMCHSWLARSRELAAMLSRHP